MKDNTDRDAWRFIGSIVLGGCVVMALIGAKWLGHRPIADFAELLAAYVLNAGIIAGALAAGVLAGTATAKASKSNAAGWVVGISALCGVFLLAGAVIPHIPGVGWRIAAMTSGNEFD
jgi:hypothetical protein